MAKKRNPQVWIVHYKLGKKKEHLITPMLVYPWQALLHVKQIKPLAEITKIESFRRLSVPK